jgi:hypothetical protein
MFMAPWPGKHTLFSQLTRGGVGGVWADGPGGTKVRPAVAARPMLWHLLLHGCEGQGHTRLGLGGRRSEGG